MRKNMQLKEIMHMISGEREKGMINIDDWKWNDVDHLSAMGFEFDGDYIMSLDSPKILIFKKEHPSGEYFVIKDERGTKAFRKFDQVIEYFDHYSQPEIDKELS